MQARIDALSGPSTFVESKIFMAWVLFTLRAQAVPFYFQ
jgi:hypothetical protein